MQRDFGASRAILDDAFADLEAPSEVHVVHHIHGTEGVLERTQDIIRNALMNLDLCLWEEELGSVTQTITEATERGVDVLLLQFGESDLLPEIAVKHVFTSPESVRHRLGTRMVVAVADRRLSVIGGSSGSGDLWHGCEDC
jgi:sugar-specific transcriptional regulator TrmB